MPDSLIAALAVTFILAFIIIFGAFIYKLTLGLFMNKAFGKIVGKDTGLKSKKLIDVENTDEPLKAVIEFEDSNSKKVKVFSKHEYDSEKYEKVFPSEDVVVYYHKLRPDRGYTIKNELNRRLIGIIIRVLLLALLAIVIELTLFIYLGMF